MVLTQANAASDARPALDREGMETSEALIRVEGLKKSYPGGVQALKGVSFQVRRGDRTCLLGPNGAGKTTVIRLLGGVLSPDAGVAHLMGVQAGTAAFLEAKRSVGIVPEAPGMYQEIKVGEYLRLVKDLYRRGSLDEVVEAFELEPYLDRPMTTLSGGYQRRVVLAAALLPEPELLILDEPTARLDPVAAAQIRRYIRKVSEGRTLLLCTHNLAEAEELCDRVIILRQGTLLVEDELKKLRNRFARHLELETVEQPERVVEVAHAAGYRARTDGAHVRVAVSDYRKEVPTLLTRLLVEGLHVYGAHVQEPSLEEIFLRLLGEETETGDGEGEGRR